MRTLLVVGVVAGVLALNVHAAQAAAVGGDCGFNTIAQETATGGQDTFTGVAYGYAVSDSGNVSVYCEVRVDGDAVASTPSGAAGAVSATAGQVTYTATDTQDVYLCAVYSGAGGGGESCGKADSRPPPPPPPVQELVDALAAEVDRILCPTFASLAGTYAVGLGPLGTVTVLFIAPDGDIYVAGSEQTWNCPPY